MRRFSRSLLVSLCGIAVICGSSAVTAQELSVAEFETLQRKLTPPPKEAWRSIPWETSLIEAQRLAVKEKKPLFIWAMDGHPLGCT